LESIPNLIKRKYALSGIIRNSEENKIEIYTKNIIDLIESARIPEDPLEAIDKIIADIRKSALLVADLTEHRQGVYFEAGFALGLGVPVIWTCRDDHKDKIHFDTRQYNCIFWRTPEELKERLINRIEATIPFPKTRVNPL
jgi:nucleoside 2-deoxyribosyltransferase